MPDDSDFCISFILPFKMADNKDWMLSRKINYSHSENLKWKLPTKLIKFTPILTSSGHCTWKVWEISELYLFIHDCWHKVVCLWTGFYL